MATTTDDPIVPLRDGPSVRASVISWLIAAEDRGLRFHVLEDGKLRVGPRDRITPADDLYLRANRDVLKVCIAYIDRVAQSPL